MRQADVKIGGVLRVIGNRWDVPMGTFARVKEVSHAGVQPLWCFRCEWVLMNGQLRRNSRSLNLFEEDLADFEPFTGPLAPPPAPQRRRWKGILPTIPSPQLALPYTADDLISDRLNLEGFPLVPNPV
jgi:hypothetical protein